MLIKLFPSKSESLEFPFNRFSAAAAAAKTLDPNQNLCLARVTVRLYVKHMSFSISRARLHFNNVTFATEK